MKTRTYLSDEPIQLGPLLFLRSVQRVLTGPPVWLLTTGLLLLIALPVGLSWHAFFEDTTANRYWPDGVQAEGEQQAEDGLAPFLWDELVYSLTPTFRQDHARGLDELNRSTEQSGAVLAVLALLIGIFAAGGWLQVLFERTRGRALRRFFLGGARYFFRFTRLFVLSVLLLGAWDWVFNGSLGSLGDGGSVWDRWVLGNWKGIPAADYDSLETLDSERTVVVLGWLRDGLHALGFALILAWGTLTRTRMALLDASSAVKAGFLTAALILRHPVKTLGPLVSLLGLEFLLVSIACGAFMGWLEEGLLDRPSVGLVVAMGLVGALALMIREVMRGASYHATMKVSQAIVRPPRRGDDPWRTIGGPGGPQYPVEDVDGSQYVAM